MPVYKEDISCKHLSYVALILIGIINFDAFSPYSTGKLDRFPFLPESIIYSDLGIN